MTNIKKATISFRWERELPNNLLNPTSLVGLKVEVALFGALTTGTVLSVEPYVDELLGPGTWVTMEVEP